MTTTNIFDLVFVLFSVALVADVVALISLVARLIVDAIALDETDRFSISDFSRRQVKINSILTSLEEIEKEEAEKRFLSALEKIETAAKLSRTQIVAPEKVVDLTIEDLEEMYCN